MLLDTVYLLLSKCLDSRFDRKVGLAISGVLFKDRKLTYG